MNTINVYNFLDGVNLCNIFANLILLKTKESFPDVRTEISVINVRNFFVVKGYTSSETLVNVAEIFQDYLNNYDEELSKKVRVFDMISYGKDVDDLPLSISYKENKKESQRYYELQNIVNGYAKNKIYINLKVDDTSKIVFFDCNENQYGDVKNILIDNFESYDYVKQDYSEEIYISEKIYGSTLHNEKPYLLLMKQISDHLFKLGISKEINLILNTSIQTKDLNNELINLRIENDNHIVKKDWLESLLMDVFPFELKALRDRFSDCDDMISLVTDLNFEDYSIYDLSTRHDMILI